MSAAAAPFFTKRISVASPSRFVFDVRTRNRRGGLDIAPLQRGGFGTAQPRVKQNTGDGSVDLRCARQYPEPPSASAMHPGVIHRSRSKCFRHTATIASATQETIANNRCLKSF